MLDMEILMKFAPASVATALASIVLPVPGGPNKRMPLHGCTEGNSQLNQNEQHFDEGWDAVLHNFDNRGE